MIGLIGHNGYVGTAYQKFFLNKGIQYCTIGRATTNVASWLAQELREKRVTRVINTAGYTGKPNVDACEYDKDLCVKGNVVLPGTIARACEELGIPWGHVSSGCIYQGNSDTGLGWTETDPPNFSFRQNNCSWYSGTKALGEEVLRNAERLYIWRLRIPFNEIDSPRNYLTKIRTYPKLLEVENSVSHLDEFVRATWECFYREVPYGIYNVVQPGPVCASDVVLAWQQAGLDLQPTYAYADELAFRTPRSSCVLSPNKLLNTGIKLRSAITEIQSSIKNWRSE